MGKLRNNIFANFGGQIWVVLMGFAFVPIYVRMLGIEAFGLISFMLSLQAISLLFDFGIGGAVNRELARRSHMPEAVISMRNLIRTAELVIWPISLLIGLIIFMCSQMIAVSWLNPEQLGVVETRTAVIAMGAAAATIWPTSFYSNALSGLEQQISMNLINSVFATLRSAGVLLAMHCMGPSIHVFLWWHAIIGLCHSLTLAAALWHHLPYKPHLPVFSLNELIVAKHFAGGLFAITVISIALTQVDRITLSTLRPLEELGYYGIAMSIAAGLGRMVQPMFNAVYPRFSRLVATRNHAQLVDLYHLSSQSLTIIIASTSGVLLIYGEQVLFLWTGDTDLSIKVAPALKVLVAGTALNGLLNMPYALQLAHGWTRLVVISNGVALLLAIPYSIWAVSHFGLLGAASIWLGINLALMIFVAPLVHKRLLPGELSSWYLRDMLPPILASAIVVITAHQIGLEVTRDILGVIILTGICAVTLSFSALSSPLLRATGRKLLRDKLCK